MSGRSQDQLTDLLTKLDAVHTLGLEQIRQHPHKERGNPFAEIYHTYASHDFKGIKLLLEGTQGVDEDRARRIYESVFQKLRHWEAVAEPDAMRMRPWEEMLDFDRMQWKGLKPSEIFEACAQRITEFMQANPDIKRKLTGQSAQGR